MKQSILQKIRLLSNGLALIKITDLPKFIPIGLMMFLILLSQNIVRVIKDSIVSINIGPEAISFIKLYLEMPFGILFCIIYTKMCNRMTTEKVFRIIFIFFICLFLTFIFLIIPNQEYFHPNPLYIKELIIAYPYFRWFLEMYSKWSYVLFYVSGELYPMIVLTLLFWHLANKITSSQEAARMYPFIGLIGHSNMLFCSKIIIFFTAPNFLFNLFSGEQELISIKLLIIVAIFCILIVLGLHLYIEKKIMHNIDNIKTKIKEKLSLSVKESINVIFKSKYLGLISILTISYSMSINLIEGIWMSKTKQLYPSSIEFMQYQGNILFYTGCNTLFVAFIANYTIRKFGWKVAALSTPIAILIGGSIFYTAIFTEEYLYMIGVSSSLAFIVFMGGLQNIIGKGVKYSLFDDTKEMSYIPLNSELKTKGKAAVDIIGGKVGKSSGAIIQFIAFTIYPYATYDDIIIPLFIIFLTICLVWIFSVIKLSKAYQEKLKEEI
ncbi:MAG: Npt1/Npt2 family nucleotide transporter [Rickettsiales bacterium]